MNKLLPSLLGAGCALGLVIGASSPAQALVYTFTNASFSYIDGSLGLTSGTANITGSFNYDGTNTLTAVNVLFNNLTGNAVNQTFTSGFVANTGAASELRFGNNVTCTAGDTTNCLRLELQSALATSGTTPVSFDTGAQNAGAYFNASNGAGLGGFGGNTARTKLLTVTGGNLQVPSPVSALMLLPLAGLSLYRKRFRKLAVIRLA